MAVCCLSDFPGVRTVAVSIWRDFLRPLLMQLVQSLHNLRTFLCIVSNFGLVISKVMQCHADARLLVGLLFAWLAE